MEVGSYQVEFLSDGDFALDGGAMFGVVPYPLWSKSHPPDERFRIAVTARCLLLRGHGRTIVVDSGNGDKLSVKQQDIYKIEPTGGRLLASLARFGLTGEDVTDVLLTHLHFDHAGGLTRPGDLRLNFPNARHYVQKEHYAWACKPSLKDQASFMPENYEPVREAGLLELLDGPEKLFPDLELILFHGHTRALQGLLIHGDPCLFYPSDLMPTSGHVRLAFNMGYDNFPLTTIQEKQTWLPRAARERWRVVFEHDARVEWACLEEKNGDFALATPVEVAR